jgi:type IV pilus assembly protein PilO
MQDYDIKDIFNLPIKIQMTMVGVFCLLIFYLGYQFDFSSEKRVLLSGQTQEKDLKMQLGALEDNISDLNKELAQLPQLQVLLKQWNAQLVKADALPDMLNDILKLGTTNQLQFQLFNPSAEIKEEAYPIYEKVPINAVAIGEYHQTANFISQVANLPTLVAVENFVMSKGQAKLFNKKESMEPGYADRLTTLVVFEIYYLANKTPSKNLSQEPSKNEK